MKYFGEGKAQSGSGRRAFLTDGDAVYVVGEGDTVLGRYRIIRINHLSVEFEEIASGRHGTAKLEDEGPPVLPILALRQRHGKKDLRYRAGFG